MASAAWANPYALHPWFKMPSLKRKDLSSDEEDAPSPPARAASLEPSRRSLSPAPSPKRRRCDPLESGMSQLTLDGRAVPPSTPPFAPGQYPYPTHVNASPAPAPAAATVYPPFLPTVQLPTTPNPNSAPAAPLWADGPHAPNVTHLPDAGASASSVVLPGSVEEPTSPQTVVEEEADAPEVKMKVPSWYEVEKDRTLSSSHASTSASFTAHRRPPRPTVTDASSSSSSSAYSSASSSRSGSAGIVITDLEGSDSEDEDEDSKTKPAADADTPPQFTISSALLDRLPKPVQALGPLAPETNPGNALVLYRPLPLPSTARVEEAEEDEEKENRGVRTPQMEAEDAPRIEEVVETEDVPIAEEEMPVDDQIEFTPIVQSVGDPQDEPMDVEML
ncbi:hypothetical protein FKP32DRAFT_1588930 [Trametes sanguinea]|nr:hypothetical protein FKP32DRAFT_1588930 [Trametes sanguinea]